MVTQREVPGRSSHKKSSSYCDSVHTIKRYSPPSVARPLHETDPEAITPKRHQSTSGSTTRPRTRPGPLKILVRAFNACRRRSSLRSTISSRKGASSPTSPRPMSPMPTMSPNETAAVRRLLAVPAPRPQHSITFASNVSSTSLLAFSSEPPSRSSTSPYDHFRSLSDSLYECDWDAPSAPSQHPYALATSIYD